MGMVITELDTLVLSMLLNNQLSRSVVAEGSERIIMSVRINNATVDVTQRKSIHNYRTLKTRHPVRSALFN